MSKIFGFLVMFCFSCSISFADDEKWDAAKEKRYQQKIAKDREESEFHERALKDIRAQHHIEYLQELIKDGDKCQQEGASCTQSPLGQVDMRYANDARKELAELNRHTK